MNAETEKQVPEKKVNLVRELTDLIKKKRTVMIASIKNLPASQFQEITKNLRGKAIIKVLKKSLILRAINESGIEKENAEKLKNQIDEDYAIVFSDMDAFELASELLQNKSPAKAKIGQISNKDIEIEAGPTELVPGPAISELGALGIQIQIDKGKINIKEPKIIVKEGEKISENAASLMNKLDIKPFYIGFIPISAYDTEENKLYLSISIDKEGTLNELKNLFGRALAFAVEIGHVNTDTLKLMIAKAAAQENKIHRIMTGEPEPVAEIKGEEPEEETKKEEAKDSAEGLASLFG